MKPKPKPKSSAQHDVEFAEGGTTKMFKQQAAGPDKPGNTGKDQSPAPGARFAKGGSKTSVGGLSRPAQGGRTGPG
jgi:hypothetical protein